jgi:ParB/RepB/Spo0J family partition protein
MTDQSTPTLEVAKIDVEDGFNARTSQSADGLERLSESIATEGVIQPLVVKAGSDGRATVIAGHRRLAAAKLAGIERVPVTYYEGERERPASLVENLHREDLDPIDAAKGLRAIAEEFGLATNKEIGIQVQMSSQWVSEHLRLLNLPEGVQRHIAAGDVPVEAERLLRKVAEVSPDVAECVCVSAKRHKVKPGDFVRNFDQLLALTAEGRFERKPTMIDARRITIGKVIADPKERKELAERINAVDRHLASEDPQVRLDESEVDAVRAAGCLIEHRVDQGDYYSVAAYITDTELAADIVHRAVERIEKQAKKREEEEAAWRALSGELTGTSEEQKEARKAEREKAKQDAAKARRFNEDLGRNLIRRRGKGSQKQHSLARAKAIAAVLLADNRELAARGLRLVLSQLQEVEVKELKSGEPREKVAYAGIPECNAFLWNRVEQARSADEVDELLGDALIAGLLADQSELALSKRVRWWTGAEEQVRKLLAADIKAVKPRRSGGKK